MEEQEIQKTQNMQNIESEESIIDVQNTQKDIQNDTQNNIKDELKKENKENKEKEQKEQESREKQESPNYVKSPEIEEDKKIIYTLRTTPNREDQVIDFITAKVKKKGIGVYSLIRPHGMRGYVFIEALNRTEAEQGAFGIPYARGLLKGTVSYHDIEHMVKEEKQERDIRKNDIAELISGPFKREKCKIVRVDPVKEEVVIELLEAAIPIPITVSMDTIKVIRREGGQNE